ncbi:MAG: hypothetical protein HRU15_10100, partial [Planctomycetes bacterium]|nr:hypothetical protein [Planctomycetota bacterium]
MRFILLSIFIFLSACSSGSGSSQSPSSQMLKNGDYRPSGGTGSLYATIISWDGVSSYERTSYNFDYIRITILGGAVSGEAKTGITVAGWTEGETLTITGGVKNDALHLIFTNGSETMELIAAAYDASYTIGYPNITEFGEVTGVAILNGDPEKTGSWYFTSSLDRSGTASRNPSKELITVSTTNSNYQDDTYDIVGGYFQLVNYYNDAYVDTRIELNNFVLTVSGEAISGATTVKTFSNGDPGDAALITVDEDVTISGSIDGSVIHMTLTFANGFEQDCLIHPNLEP